MPTAFMADHYCASPDASRDAVLRCLSGVSPRQNPAPDQQSSISCCIESGEERSESKAVGVILDAVPDKAAQMAATFRALGIEVPSPDEDAIFASMDEREASISMIPQAFRQTRYVALRRLAVTSSRISCRG